MAAPGDELLSASLLLSLQLSLLMSANLTAGGTFSSMITSCFLFEFPPSTSISS